MVKNKNNKLHKITAKLNPQKLLHQAAVAQLVRALQLVQTSCETREFKSSSGSFFQKTGFKAKKA